jgi:nucleoside-diphosphate-sugar epimerase
MNLGVLVTGSSGFIGRVACRILSERGHRLKRAVRDADSAAGADPDTIEIGDIAAVAQWTSFLAGIDVVLHLAGRAHVMTGITERDPETAYRRTNVVGTNLLARACARQGVRRLVYVSSIKVNGESTGSHGFRETDPVHPKDEYGRSKWEAERCLQTISRETGLEVVVVRPPLVYGPGVKGNLARLMRMVDLGIPLPVGNVDNRRSFIGVGNLADALRLCIEHPGATGQTFLVSDGFDVSTPVLISMLAEALGRPARLLPAPASLLQIMARFSGSAARLVNSLQVDSTHIRARLGWHPPYSLGHEIAAMVQAYRSSHRSRRHHRL